MNEIWKDIRNYEGMYQVSNLGNVRSLNWKRTGETRKLWIKPHSGGYAQVELTKNGKRTMFTVHKLVALHFVNGYKDGLVVNHIDEDKKNNNCRNLEWVTQSENVFHSWRKNNVSNSLNKRIGEKCNVPIVQLTINGEFVKVWDCANEIKSQLGYSDWSIKECCKNNRKKAYGFKWQFAS